MLSSNLLLRQDDLSSTTTIVLKHMVHHKTFIFLFFLCYIIVSIRAEEESMDTIMLDWNDGAQMRSPMLQNDYYYHHHQGKEEEKYLAYNVSLHLLDKSSEYCTNFVFPGKSLCNLVVTQTVMLNMNLTNSKGRVSMSTPAFPIKVFDDLEAIEILHVNSLNSSLNEECSVEESSMKKDDDGTETMSFKFSFFEKTYPNPQLFHIKLKAVGAVKPLKSSQQNSFTVQVMSKSLMQSIKDIGYVASVIAPYHNFTDFMIEPKPTYIHNQNDTHTFIFDNRVLDVTSQNLTIAMTFPEYYPHCLQMRLPTIIMWSAVGAITAIVIIYVTFQCLYEQLQKKRHQEGYDQLM
jgi:hypothetical protein